jgi:hypothetical protein
VPTPLRRTSPYFLYKRSGVLLLFRQTKRACYSALGPSNNNRPHFTSRRASEHDLPVTAGQCTNRASYLCHLALRRRQIKKISTAGYRVNSKLKFLSDVGPPSFHISYLPACDPTGRCVLSRFAMTTQLVHHDANVLGIPGLERWRGVGGVDKRTTSRVWTMFVSICIGAWN